MSKKVGLQLRQAREARSLTIEQVAKNTHMRLRYLQAMEAGEFDALPSKVQARGFLRAYASYLELDEVPLLLMLDGEDKSEQPEPSPTEDIPEPDKPRIEEAEAVFLEIGHTLNYQRELLGLSLEDVERHTHLRQRYLLALESGNLQALPSPVQGRGMLNNYAIFLGLDPEPLLLRFAEGLQMRLAARQAVQKKPESRSRSAPVLPAPLRRIFSGDILIGCALAIFLIIFVIWGAIRIFSMQTDQEPTSTAPSIAEVLLATPTPTLTATPLPATSTSPPPALLFPTQALPTDALGGTPAQGQGDIQIYITVRQRAWMRVVVDGKTEFDGRVIPGSAYAFTGEIQVEVLTGNGAALSIFFNQQDLGAMGAFGQVVHKVYTLQGVQAPTPTITLSPTATQPATATPDTAGTEPPPLP